MSLIDLLNPASESMSLRHKIYGVVVGVVRDVKDPQKLGRVKVDFPWLAEEADSVSMSEDEDRAHSYWARVAVLMAGAGRGAYFVPEVGDEVLVAFEHGDLDRPCVLGGLWNKDDTPPETMDAEGKNAVRSITSRSGHRIVLDDSDDKPSVLIVDKTGANSLWIDSANNAMAIKVKGDLSFEVDGNITMTAKGKITITAGQDIAAETKANLELKAKGNGALEAAGPLNVKSGAKLSMDGSGQAELKAAAVSVNGSGLAELKGGIVKIN